MTPTHVIPAVPVGREVEQPSRLSASFDARCTIGIVRSPLE